MALRSDSPAYPLRTTPQAVDIAERASRRAGAPLRITFDAYHMLQTDGDLLPTLRRHIGSIAHVQIADVPGRGAPGTGRLPTVALLRELADLHYAGAVGLEYVPSRPPAGSFDWLATPV